MKKFFTVLLLFTLHSSLFTLTMQAQKKLFTLEELNYGGTNYHQVVPENKYYTWWGDELIRTDVEECYLVDKKTGKETLLFSLDDVNKWTDANDTVFVRHLMNATFPYPDKSLVALGNRKSFILVDFKTKALVWQDSIAEQKAYDWSAASKNTAFVKDNQLMVVDAKGHCRKITADGSRNIVYGQTVHRNEFGIEKGTFWSPDGELLAFYRMDQTSVADYPQVDITTRIASYEPDKYPMVGEQSHYVTVGVYDVKNDKTIYLATNDQPTPSDSYLTNIAWSPDSKVIYIFHLNREQNDCRLKSYDATTGKCIAEIYRETSDKYVEPLHPIVFLPWDDNKFILQSQRDGYNHLYLYNKDGKLLKQLTKGKFVVEELVGFNEKKQSVIITSNEANAIQRNTYSVDIKSGKRTLLDNGRGSHRAMLSASGEWFVDRYTEPTVPRNIEVRSTQGTGKSTMLLCASDPWSEYVQPIFESGTILAADGTTEIYYRMVKPNDFDPTKKYPTVVYVYGGPHAHNVEASWHWQSRSWETYMAQKGYIIFILDNRGSENRGRDFEQVTFHQLGQVEMQDQMEGVKFLKSLPYVDSERLGVHGWSFGGFMTISLMTNYPDIFKVGVAGGPVIDWRWYEVMYGERYMGTPQNNDEGYEKISLISKAKNLKGKLQIITGYNDNTVVPQNCLSFLNACIEAGTQPDFFVYPGEEHNMRGHKSVHLHERITQYFEDYLK